MACSALGAGNTRGGCMAQLSCAHLSGSSQAPRQLLHLPGQALVLARCAAA